MTQHPPTYDPRYGYQPGGEPRYPPAPGPPPQAGTNGLAITSLILGSLSFCVPFACILAITFGILGMGQTRQYGQKGRELAIAGVVLGSLGAVLYTVIIILGVTGHLDE